MQNRMEFGGISSGRPHGPRVLQIPFELCFHLPAIAKSSHLFAFVRSAYHSLVGGCASADETCVIGSGRTEDEDRRKATTWNVLRTAVKCAQCQRVNTRMMLSVLWLRKLMPFPLAGLVGVFLPFHRRMLEACVKNGGVKGRSPYSSSRPSSELL